MVSVFNVLAGFAKDNNEDRAEVIKERGEELKEQRLLYQQIALNKYSADEALYSKHREKYQARDNALQSLGGKATKDEIAVKLALLDGRKVDNATEEQREFILQSYYGDIQEQNKKGKDGKDLLNSEGVPFKQYIYTGNHEPIAPMWGKKYYDSEVFFDAKDNIESGTKGKWTTAIRGEGFDTGDQVLATLQNDLEEGAANNVRTWDTYFKEKNNVFDAKDGSLIDKSFSGVVVIHRGTGELIDLESPNFRDGRENAIFKQIQITYDKDRDDRSTDFRNIVNDNIVANIPGIEIQQFMTVGTDGKVSGVKPAASALVNRISSLQLEIVEANYHTAGWTTQNPEDNSTGALISRLNTEVNRRILPISSNFKFFKIDIPDIGTPIEGQYIIPTSIIPLYENIPAQVKNSNGELVNTMPYLQQELEKIVEVEGENKKATLSNIYNILDKRTAEILKPVQSEEIKKDIPIVSEDGNTFTIGEQSYSFEKLDERLLQLDDKEKSKISESIMEAYNLWKKNQEKESSEVTIEKQMEEVIPDISKMQLGTVIEKDLVTAEYLNSYTKDVSFSGKEEFYAGNNMMLNIGDEVTTKDGIKYESYVDTTTDNQGREISTLKFKPITIE